MPWFTTRVAAVIQASKRSIRAPCVSCLWPSFFNCPHLKHPPNLKHHWPPLCIHHEPTTKHPSPHCPILLTTNPPVFNSHNNPLQQHSRQQGPLLPPWRLRCAPRARHIRFLCLPRVFDIDAVPCFQRSAAASV
jgi:hypothetical protein